MSGFFVKIYGYLPQLRIPATRTPLLSHHFPKAILQGNPGAMTVELSIANCFARIVSAPWDSIAYRGTSMAFHGVL